jgi:hypothetical protein
MTRACSKRSLTILWLLNLAFFSLSFFIQDFSNNDPGFMDLPVDQNIVCQSGVVKKRTPNTLKDFPLTLSFFASTKNFQVGKVENFKFEFSLDKNKKYHIDLNLFSENDLKLKPTRGPPLLFS